MLLYIFSGDGVQYDDTVTVYNACEDGGLTKCQRTVIHGVSWSDTKNRNVNRTGEASTQSLLLIVPQGADGKTYIDPLTFTRAANTYTFKGGDKVVLGECAYVVAGETATALSASWNYLSNKNFDHLVIIKNIDVKRFGGVVHHVEVGG